MDKRYQIFISSTFEDLKEERKIIIDHLLNEKYIPAGMEMFCASPDEQFEVIKKIIDNCDYYILVLGGRYGSINPFTGISYTEQEYDYAISKEIPVLAFLHRTPYDLPFDKRDDDKREYFDKFRNKVQSGRVCRYWETQYDLVSSVANSINNIVISKPGVGWVRGSVNKDKIIFELENQISLLNDEIEEVQRDIDKYVDRIKLQQNRIETLQKNNGEFLNLKKRESELVNLNNLQESEVRELQQNLNEYIEKNKLQEKEMEKLQKYDNELSNSKENELKLINQNNLMSSEIKEQKQNIKKYIDKIQFQEYELKESQKNNKELIIVKKRNIELEERDNNNNIIINDYLLKNKDLSKELDSLKDEIKTNKEIINDLELSKREQNSLKKLLETEYRIDAESERYAVNMANEYCSNRQYPEAIKCLLKATIFGGNETCFQLAEIYSNIDSVKDARKAAEYYLIAAQNSHPGAQNALGYLYENGDGVEKDINEAAKWYLEGAKNNNRSAQHNIGYYYYIGRSVDQNYQEAFKWFLKSAEQGYGSAQNNVGVMYEYGHSVAKDINKAMQWYKRAADSGNKDGNDNYNRILKKYNK